MLLRPCAASHQAWEQRRQPIVNWGLGNCEQRPTFPFIRWWLQDLSYSNGKLAASAVSFLRETHSECWLEGTRQGLPVVSTLVFASHRRRHPFQNCCGVLCYPKPARPWYNETLTNIKYLRLGEKGVEGMVSRSWSLHCKSLFLFSHSVLCLVHFSTFLSVSVQNNPSWYTHEWWSRPFWPLFS